MLSFVEVIENDQFLNPFDVQTWESKGFMEWLLDADIPPAHRFGLGGNPIKRAVECKEKQYFPVVEATNIFHECNDLMLRELDTELVRQVLRGSVPVQNYGSNTKESSFDPATNPR